MMLTSWITAVGTLLIGFGTIGMAYGAISSIPRKLGQHYKSKEIISLYQKVVFRMYRQVEASTQGISFRVPEDVEQLTKLLIQKFPQIGTKEDADRIMDDLMLDDYFRTVRGNATVIETAKWDPRDRTKKVKPKVEDLPSGDQ